MVTVDEKLAQIVSDIDAARDETDLDAIAESVLDAINTVKDAMNECDAAASAANSAYSMLDDAFDKLRDVENELTKAVNRG